MDKKRLALMAALFCLIAALAACAPQQQVASGDASPVEDDASAMEMVAWSPESDCAQCHVDETTSVADPATGAGFHSTQNLQCVTCHADASMSDVHADYASGKVPSELHDTAVSSDTCLSSGCHDREDLKQRTAETTVLTDSKGTTVNPHDLPENEDHESVTCVMCHEMHTGESVQEVAPAKCLGCHHKGTYECGTCH